MSHAKYKDADVWPFVGSVPFLLKPGREALDPLNRKVTVISKTGDDVKVRLPGPYGATCTYSASCLRPVTE